MTKRRKLRNYGYEPKEMKYDTPKQKSTRKECEVKALYYESLVGQETNIWAHKATIRKL